MTEYKIGDIVRCENAMQVDIEVGIRDGAVGVVKEVSNVAFVKFDGITINHGGENNRGGAWAMFDHQLERVASSLPESPFYIRAPGGEEFMIEVVGSHYHATGCRGEIYSSPLQTKEMAIKHIERGAWIVIDPPAPAVDAATTASLEVQRLLREREAAGAEREAAQAVLDKAEENYRNIGKELNKAKCRLDRANHEAAGVKFDPIPYGFPQ